MLTNRNRPVNSKKQLSAEAANFLQLIFFIKNQSHEGFRRVKVCGSFVVFYLKSDGKTPPLR